MTVNDAANPYVVEHELAVLLKAAAQAGDRVLVKADEETYELEVTPAARSDLWKGYDPEQVLAAVRRSAALGSSADPADLDHLVADLRAHTA